MTPGRVDPVQRRGPGRPSVVSQFEKRFAGGRHRISPSGRSTGSGQRLPSGSTCGHRPRPPSRGLRRASGAAGLFISCYSSRQGYSPKPGHTIACVVLEDGRRVLSTVSFIRAIGRTGKMKQATEIESVEGSSFTTPPFLVADNLKPFIEKHLEDPSALPIPYRSDPPLLPCDGFILLIRKNELFSPCPCRHNNRRGGRASMRDRSDDEGVGGGGRREVDPDISRDDLIRDLAQQGLSFKRLARLFRLSRQHVSRIVKATACAADSGVADDDGNF